MGTWRKKAKEARLKATRSKTFERARKVLLGTDLVVLGDHEVGKTVIHAFLREGRLVTDYVETIGAKKLARSGKLELGVRVEEEETNSPTGKIRLSKGWDIGGAMVPNADRWKESVWKADIILYVFDAVRITTGDQQHIRLIKDQCATIATWISARQKVGIKPPLVAMVGTHCDLIPDFGPVDTKEYADFDRLVSRQISLYKPRMKLGGVLPCTPPLSYGSLKSIESADELLARVLFKDLDL